MTTLVLIKLVISWMRLEKHILFLILYIMEVVYIQIKNIKIIIQNTYYDYKNKKSLNG